MIDEPKTDQANSIQEFRRDVIDCLSSEQKRLSSKYFYDKNGDAIFQRIMAAPEYYLTRAENRILSDNSKEIIQSLTQSRKGVDMIELGAGDGSKTKHLLRAALELELDPTYRPVDISQHILDELGEALNADFPSLNYRSLQGDYFGVLEKDELNGAQPKCILFLGSNIGNLGIDMAGKLLGSMRQTLNPADRLMVGFDLKKNPQKILAAYNDAGGATRDFNLNLLDRINRELGANFDTSKFIHAPIYDPFLGRALSYLIATEELNITLDGCDEVFPIRAWEAIHLEISQKYEMESIKQLATISELEIDQVFSCEQDGYVDVIFKPKQVQL